MTFEEKKASSPDDSDEEPKSSTPVVIMTVTNGFDQLYRVELTHNFMARQRQACSIEGTWQSYFDLLQ